MSNTIVQDLDTIKTVRDNMKTALEGKGQTVTKDIRTYAKAIANIEGGGTVEGIKQFSTVEEMQSDTTAQEGDLAVVYRSEIQNATVDSRFQIATFPNTVILDTAITDYVDVRYRPVDSSVMFDCRGSLDNSMFMMDCHTENGSIRIQYTSSDGITYTRTDTTGNPVDFGTEIYYAHSEMWNDDIGKFIQIGSSTFEGLYECLNVERTTEYILDNITYVFPTEFINKVDELLELYDPYYSTIIVDNYVERANKREVVNCSFYLSGSAQTFVFTTLDTGNKYICTRASSNDYVCRYDNGSISVLGGKDASSVFAIPVYSTYDQFYADVSHSPNSVVLQVKPNKPIGEMHGTIPTLNSSSGYIATDVNNIIFNKELEYLIVKAQLTATPDYVYEKEFYGKNGVGTGTLVQDISNSFADINAEVYSKIQQTYDSMEPRILTDSDKTIDKNIYFIPVKKDGTVLLDTSSVTNMDSMFSGCKNLTEIPLLNTSNVTNMTNMFLECIGLSDESLNNILAMCANATSYTYTKTLKYIGLTSEQATKCTTLSNYSSFTAAGWTTGY